MAGQLDAIKDDISFLKSLAHEGRGAAMGGSVLVLAGTLYGLAAFFDWMVAVRLVPLGWTWMSYSELIATALFIPALIVINRRLERRRQAGPLHRLIAAAWQGVGYAIFALAAVYEVVVWRTGDYKVFYTFGALVLVLYGVGWLVSAVATATRWMRLVALGCLAAALALAFTAGTHWANPIAVIALFLFAVVPGIVLMRRAPKQA